MSVYKLGSPLTSYEKTSSIFEGHPGASLGTVGQIGIVHGGSLQIPVYLTIYEAYANGAKEGDVIGIGGLYPTGLIPNPGAGGDPFPGEEMEHSIEMIEEVKSIEEVEAFEGEPGEEVVVEPGEEVIPGDEPFVIAEDCELVVHFIKIFGAYELRLCEAKAGITTIAGLLADVVTKTDSVVAMIDDTKKQKQELSVLLAEAKDERTEASNQATDLQTTYTELVEACAKASAEGPAGNEQCQNLNDFIAKGNLDNIGILLARVAELSALIQSYEAQLAEIDRVLESLDVEMINLKQSAKDYEDAGVAQEELVTKAENTYANLGGSVAPSIGQLNSIAIGKTSISSTCVSGGGECCPLPDGPPGESALFNLQFLAKMMVEGGEGPPPEA